MSRKIGLGVYFILAFISIVSFALLFFRGPIIGYFTATPEIEGVDVISVADSKGATYFQEEVFKPECEADLRGVVSSRGITYIEDDVIDKFSERDEVRVIINFKRDIGDLNLNEDEFEKKRKFKNFFSGELKKTGLVKLIDSLGDEIESIQVDQQLITMVDDDVPKIRTSLAWDYGLSGKDQTVCVIDTGIDYTHEGLSDKYIGGYDFVNDDADPMDDHGHGTYMAGIVAGVAPGAKIIAAKALGENGVGYESDIIAAIDYCIENKDLYNISVILMALGGGSFGGYCDAVLVTKEANFASEQGIFVVAASGNGRGDNLTAPACGTRVTSVGATTRMTDRLFCSTNINPLLDLLAPGMHITTTMPEGRFGLVSGTSTSAAVVAGAALLVLENEPFKPMELEYRFRATGFLIEHDGANYPRIDVYNALTNNVTNTPSEQTGEQSEGNWVEYKPAAACNCFGDGDCAPGYYCEYDDPCTPWEGGNGWCYDCYTLGTDCVEGEYDSACCYSEGNHCEWE